MRSFYNDPQLRIAYCFSKVSKFHEFSRTSFSCALLTISYRVRTRHAVGTDSASRCKRYQVVCGIFRSSSGELRIRSTITRGKLPSLKSRSAALTASRVLVQRTQSNRRRMELASAQGSNESRPSISATKYLSRYAPWMKE